MLLLLNQCFPRSTRVFLLACLGLCLAVVSPALALTQLPNSLLERTNRSDDGVGPFPSNSANRLLDGISPLPSAINFTSGTHTNTATVTFNSVVQDNPTFTTTGTMATNPAALATFTTPAPTTQSATSTVSASFDGIATFMAALTAGANGNRPTSNGNSEIGTASSTFVFTLTTVTPYQLSGNSTASVMGAGSSTNFFVTLSEATLGVIATNGDIFGPFSFSGTLQPGNYTMSAAIEANGFPGSTNPAISSSGNYVLALVPEPSTPALAFAGAAVLLLFWRLRVRA